MSSSYVVSLPGEIELDIEYQMTSDLRKTWGHSSIFIQNVESNLDVFHFLLDGIGPEGIAIDTI